MNIKKIKKKEKENTCNGVAMGLAAAVDVVGVEIVVVCCLCLFAKISINSFVVFFAVSILLALHITSSPPLVWRNMKSRLIVVRSVGIEVEFGFCFLGFLQFRHLQDSTHPTTAQPHLFEVHPNLQ